MKNYDARVETLFNDEILKDNSKFDSLSRVYLEIFNRHGENEWGENWSLNEVKDYLRNCLLQKNSENIVILLINDLNRIIGFHIGHIGTVHNVIKSYQMPKDLSEESKSNAEHLIYQKLNIFNKKKSLYSQDLGLLFEFRKGSKRLENLFTPMMELALERDVEFGFFWTSNISRLFNLSKIVDAKIIYNFNDQQKNFLLQFEIKRLLDICKLSEDEIRNIFIKINSKKYGLSN